MSTGLYRGHNGSVVFGSPLLRRVSQNCSAGSRSRSSWNFSTALPLFHLSVSGSCFIAVKCYSFSLSPEIDCTLAAAANKPGPAATFLGHPLAFAQPRPQVIARRWPELGRSYCRGEGTMSQVKYCSTTEEWLQREGAIGWLLGRPRPMTDDGPRSDAARALIAVVNDSVFVEEIYSGRRSEGAGFPVLWAGRPAARSPHWM